jgi:predicted transcriptional regulator
LRWRRENDPEAQTIFDVVSDVSIPVAHPDEVVARLADRMVADDLGRVPVVERESGKLVGLVARKDLIQMRAASRSLERDRKAYYMRPKRPDTTPL